MDKQNAGNVRIRRNGSIPYQSKLTSYVVWTCIMAGSGGLIYGYDLVVAGGVAVMDDFLAEFYPKVLAAKRDAHQSNYCKYHNDVFQLFSSFLYLAALPSTLIASHVTRRFGRRPSMFAAGLLFCGGSVLGASSHNLGMLLTARALLGCGLGFSNQVVPMYLSEVAPAHLRGVLNYTFSMYCTFGILCANIVNYLVVNIHPWGWRLALGIAGVPSVLLIIFSMVLVETPTSLIQRGQYDHARVVLERIRGTNKVDEEFEDIMEAIKLEANVVTRGSTWKKMKTYIPQLTIGMAFPFFQQMAGNDAILFYGVFLFKTAGFGDAAALYSAVITGSIGFLGSCFAAFVVDRIGRRKLLFGGASVLIVAMVAVGVIFAIGLPNDLQRLPKGEGVVQVVALCLFVASFTSSLGPLAWLIPSEIYPLNIRPLGLSLTVCVNVLFKFIIAQTFLSLLCVFKYGAFFFFAGWMISMCVFMGFLLPETKGIPLDAMQHVWSSHWFWKKIISSDINRHTSTVDCI